jgi:hypothetical protein
MSLLALLLFIAVCQCVNMSSNSQVIDLSDCMFDYIMAQHNETHDGSTDKEPEAVPAETNETVEEYVFIGNKTIVNLVMGSTDKCTF